LREIPVIAPLPKEGYWVLLDDTLIKVDGVVFIVPKGFETDFASVPRLFWWFISPTDRDVLRASLLHDYLYRIGKERGYADKLFYLKLVEDRVPKWKAKLMYWVVRLFGNKAWRKYGESTKNS
jgi:hypothetical protein